MLLGELVTASQRVGATRSRREKIAHLEALLRRLAPHEIETSVAFLTGYLTQGKVGLGWAAIRGAAPGTSARLPTLTLKDVDAAFARIAGVCGKGAVAERQRLLGGLLARATQDEQGFLVRLVFGELRQGALVGLMVDAVAKAAEVPASKVRRAQMLAGNITEVARAALTEGRAGLAEFRLQLFRPLQPMLAAPVEDLEEALQRLGEAALEHKIDGVRVQLHKAGDDVRVFSRRLNDVTAAVPELVERAQAFPARELVLDGEVLALRADGSPLPFQVTMRRFGRKLDVERMRQQLPLTPFYFDVLHMDGEDLFDRPAGQRFAALAEVAPHLVVPRLVTADRSAAEEFMREALESGHEGVMAKAIDAPYAAGSRGFSWLKLKSAHTLDLVVLAAELGSGRRRGWLSNLHLGARDPETGDFVMLGKTFKGMTDETLAWQTKRFQKIATRTDGNTVLVRPEVVVEVAFSDVQRSARYPGGVALRFARIKRYRDDKSPDQADTIDTVRRLLAISLTLGPKPRDSP